MPISDAVQTALIVAVPTFLSAPIALWLANRGKAAEARLAAQARAEEKKADWDRQDAVADKAAQLAAQQIATAEAAAKRVEQVAKQAKEAAELLVTRQDSASYQSDEQSALMRATSAKIDVVHGLVNSQYTAAVQSEMDATVALLAVLEEIVGMKAAANQPVGQTTRDAVESTKKKIAELRVTLTERQKQAKVADKATAVIAETATPKQVTDVKAIAKLKSIDTTLKKQTKAVDKVTEQVKEIKDK